MVGGVLTNERERNEGLVSEERWSSASIKTKIMRAILEEKIGA